MTPRERRVVKVSAVVVLAALLILRLLPWGWKGALSQAEEQRRRADLLARAEAAVASAPMLQDSAVAVKAKLVTLAPRILSGRHESEALADLAGRISALAVSRRLRLSRSSPLKDSVRAGSLRRLSLRVALEGDSRGALGFLSALASGPEVLVVDDLRLTARDPSSPATLPEVLEMEATVQGWYLARDSMP